MKNPPNCPMFESNSPPKKKKKKLLELVPKVHDRRSSGPGQKKTCISWKMDRPGLLSRIHEFTQCSKTIHTKRGISRTIEPQRNYDVCYVVTNAHVKACECATQERIVLTTSPLFSTQRTNLRPLSQQSSNVACRTLSSSLWFLGTEKPIFANGPKIGYDWIMVGIFPIFRNTWVPYCHCRAPIL